MRTLQAGETVLASDGSRLGEVQSLVVDERAHRVTHLVIGDRVVSVRRVTATEDESLRLDLDPEGLRAQPNTRQARLAGAPTHWDPPSGWARSNFLRIAEAFVGQGPYIPPVTLDDDVEDVHEITEGSPVWSGDDQVGRVASVETDDRGSIAWIAVAAHHRLVRVPIDAVVEVIANNVHLRTSPEEFGKLPDVAPHR